jgi:hypothetical protein
MRKSGRATRTPPVPAADVAGKRSTPGALDEDTAAGPLLPMRGRPVGARMGRAFPAAADPDVAAGPALPRPIAIDPDKIGTGPGDDKLHLRRRLGRRGLLKDHLRRRRGWRRLIINHLGWRGRPPDVGSRGHARWQQRQRKGGDNQQRCVVHNRLVRPTTSLKKGDRPVLPIWRLQHPEHKPQLAGRIWGEFWQGDGGTKGRVRMNEVSSRV